MSPGNAPTLLILLPSMTMASLRLDGLPEPSISVPLRITRVFVAALMGSSGYSFALPTLYNVAVIRRGAGRGAKKQALAFSRCMGIRVIVQAPDLVYATLRQAKPNQTEARKWSAGRRQSVAAPRERMLPSARAPGAARATERPLAGIACFGRAAPPGAPPRSAAPAVDRRSFRPLPLRRDRYWRPASCKRARRSPKAPLDGASQGRTKLRFRFF